MLEAWKAGKGTADLQSGEPQIHVADTDWSSGRALKGYEVAAPPEQRGGHWRVPAVLVLSGANRPDERRPAAYAVTLEPAITVLRADDVRAQLQSLPPFPAIRTRRFGLQPIQQRETELLGARDVFRRYLWRALKRIARQVIILRPVHQRHIPGVSARDKILPVRDATVVE